jgi:large subunit ribosomal protein L10
LAKKSIDPQKLQTVQKLETMFKESKTIAISSLHKVRSTQLMSLRKSFRNDLTILVVKNNLAKIALSKSDISKSKELSDEIKGSTVFLFSKMDPFKLQMVLNKGKIDVSAKPGDIATNDIVVPSGNTGIPPGPALSEFKGLDIPTKIETGMISITNDTVVAKTGDEVTPPLSSLLSRLSIKPIRAGISIKLSYFDGFLFSTEDVAIDLDEFITTLSFSHNSALSLGINENYFSVDTISFILNNAYNNAFNLSINADVLNSDSALIILQKEYSKATTMLGILKEKGYLSE